MPSRLSLFVFLFPVCVSAQNTTREHLGIMTVTAPATQERPQADIPSGGESLQIDGNLSYELGKLRGVEVLELSGPGSYSTLSIRGSQARQVDVFFEGVRLNRASGGAVDLSLLDFSGWKSAEVYRDATPAALPGNAPAGSVNLQSGAGKQAKPVAGITVGSAESRSAEMRIPFQDDFFHGSLNLSFLKSQGDFSFVDRDGSERKRSNNDLRRNGFLLEATSSKMRILCALSSMDRGMPGKGSHPTREARYRSHLSILSLGYKAGEDVRLKLYQKSETDRFKDLAPPSGELGLGLQHNRYQTSQYGVGVVASRPTGSLSVMTLGTDISREDWRGRDLYHDSELPDAGRNRVSAALENHSYMQDARLLLMPQLRAEWTKSKFDALSGTNDQDDFFAGASFSFRYRLSPSRQVTGHLGRGWRLPDFYELFGDRGISVPNEELQPESNLKLSVGLQEERTLASRDERHNLDLFLIRSDNLIRTVYDARGVGRAENLSETRRFGLEYQCNLKLPKDLNLLFRWTRIESEITDSPFAYEKGKQIPGVWRNSFFIGVDKKISCLSAGVEYSRRDGKHYDSANFLKAESQGQLDAFVELPRAEYGTFRLDIRNISDESIEDSAGYPLLGRSFFLGWENTVK